MAPSRALTSPAGIDCGSQCSARFSAGTRVKLRANPDAKLKIEGNADERGSSEYNLALGQRRAEGVLRALKAGGVADDRLEAVSFGKEKPRGLGHDETSWAENRRSDFAKP